MGRILKSYFFWTYSRGSFHYDVMVTLILVFLFATPWIPGWSYGDKPSMSAGPAHPIQVVGDGDHGIIVTVQGADVTVPPDATVAGVRKVLRKAIEPVTGDAVSVEHWETVQDSQGNTAWKVWAHR